jgi:hypothetical protein
MDIKGNKMRGCKFDFLRRKQGTVADCCESANEASGSIK